MSTLPAPSADALAHSHRLLAHIQREIDAAGGWLPFADYMNSALYAPGLGYYSAGATKFGSAGDFVTAPEMSPLFGQTLARQIADILPHTAGSVLEFGAGSGKLARDILLELERLNCLPECYIILDLSADLRQRQRELIERDAGHLLARVAWLNEFPEGFDGVVIANEVLDAMPAHLVVHAPSGWLERGVIWHNEQLAWEDRDIDNAELASRCQALTVAQPYLTELSLANRGFMHMLAQRLARGVILLVDYGFGASEYYHPQRNQGTLMCHYRHHAHGDPFFLPGLQDITVHVDFSAICDSALAHGLELLGYTSQANFLMNAGITQLLGELDPDDARHYLPQANAVQKLVSPAEMGELFKFIAFGKGVDIPLAGFASGDRSRML